MIRLLDVLISGTALALLSPALALIALVLRFTGEREVFFPPAEGWQRRPNVCAA